MTAASPAGPAPAAAARSSSSSSAAARASSSARALTTKPMAERSRALTSASASTRAARLPVGGRVQDRLRREAGVVANDQHAASPGSGDCLDHVGRIDGQRGQAGQRRHRHNRQVIHLEGVKAGRPRLEHAHPRHRSIECGSVAHRLGGREHRPPELLDGCAGHAPIDPAGPAASARGAPTTSRATHRTRARR